MKYPRLFNRLWRASIGFSSHDGSLVAAGVAYYVALSFCPLLLVLAAGVSLTLRGTDWGLDSKERIIALISNSVSPELNLAPGVRAAFQAASENAKRGGAIGFVFLVIAAIALFAQIDYAFDRIWNLGVVRHESWLQWIKRHVVARFKALAMLVGMGALLLAMMIATFVWSTMQQVMTEAGAEPWLSWAGGIGVNLALNYVALSIVYKFVPKPYIRWREALSAGLVTAPLWEIGRQLLAVYLLRLNYPTVYGIVGTFLAIMLWAYYAIVVVLFGAEYVRVRQHERVADDRGASSGATR
jgi:membrane protein